MSSKKSKKKKSGSGFMDFGAIFNMGNSGGQNQAEEMMREFEKMFVDGNGMNIEEMFMGMGESGKKKKKK